METKTISQQQREALIQRIDRRMARWPDEALVRLEELTRTAQAFGTAEDQPHARSTQPKLEPIPLAKWQEAPMNKQPDAKITRREAFLYGAGGMMALATASTGTAWFQNTNELQSLRESWSSHLGPLVATCNAAAAQKDASNRQIQDFQARLPHMYQRMTELRDVTAHISALFDDLNENESLKDMDVTRIASIVFTLGDKLETLVNYLITVPGLILAGQNMLDQLDGWFSEHYDVNARLFQPLQLDLFDSIDDICVKVNGMDQIE